MIKHNKHKDLACMYKLLTRVDSGLNTMCSTISAYLRDLGKSLVTEDDSTTAITYTQVNFMSIMYTQLNIYVYVVYLYIVTCIALSEFSKLKYVCRTF